MESNRKIAIWVGVLYIIGTVAGVLSVAFTSSALSGPDYLIKVAANESQVITGALFVLIMGLALAMVPVLLFPILRKFDQILAMGYVVFRGALETMTYIAVAASWLLLVGLAQESVGAGAAAAPYFLTMGDQLTKAADVWAMMTSIVFPLGALMLYGVFYQSKLIPRWLSVWGMIGVLLHFGSAGLAAMFGVTSSFSAVQIVVAVPIFLQEMVMAVWLIVKGFNTSVAAPRGALAAGAAD